MAIKTDAYYREVVQRVLDREGFAEPPLDMPAVATALGVPVRGVHLPAFFSGAIVAEDGMPVFVVNAARDELHQRATLAHMIGHVVEVLEVEGGTYPRNASDHRLADVMGSELVLPGNMVAEEARKWFNDYRYLARLFGVSEGEMLEKMKALGLIRDRGIHWDY